MTGKQRREIECLKFFYKDAKKATPEDIKNFLAHSDRGEKIDKTPGTEALNFAKSRRDFQIKAWGEDVQMGIMFVWELAEELPPPVLHFTKKAILGGRLWNAFEHWEKQPD